MFVNNFLSFFDNFLIFQGNFLSKRLCKWKFKGELVTVSNGIVPENIQTERKEKPEEIKDKLVVLTIGRYSKEKNQQELLRAIAKSKYKEKALDMYSGATVTKEFVKLYEELLELKAKGYNIKTYRKAFKNGNIN